MDTVWFGIKIGVGIAIGIALMRFVWREITGFLLARQFTRRGCDYQHEGASEGHPNGWMTRDPHSNDWILWDIQRNRMMRLSDRSTTVNTVETVRGKLGRVFEARGSLQQLGVETTEQPAAIYCRTLSLGSRR